jgi:glycosyltransferase involved in cell wall biosynthesis
LTEPLRVLILASTFASEQGGVPRFVGELGRALDPQRVQPILAALWDYQSESDRRGLTRLQQTGLEAIVGADWDERAPYRSCLAALRGLWRQVNGPVDLIHSHGEFADLAAIALRRHLRARAIVRTVHNEIEWAKRPWFGRFFPNFIYPFAFSAEYGVAEQVVANLDQRPAARLLGLRATKVYNALNFSRFETREVDRAAKRQTLGLPADAFVVGSVGRLAPQKGYHLLLAAAALVLQQAPDAHFLIVGAGPLAVALQQQADGLGIAGCVHFTGVRNDVEELYAVMDCFVSSSLWEGLPTVVMESMAAGVPVVVTSVAGNRELVNDGATGLLAPAGDAPALAAALLRLYKQPDWARQLAANAREKAQAHFSIEAVAQQQAKLYWQLLKK